MSVCTQTISVTVQAPPSSCPDWSTLLWGVPFISTTGAGTAVMAPDSVASASFAGAVHAPNKTDDVGPDTAGADNQGVVTGYTGGACNCNLHLTVTLTNLPDYGFIDIVFQFGIAGPQTDLWNSQVSGVNGTNTYDIPFVVPDTFGVPTDLIITIAISTNWQGVLPTLPNANVILSMSGTFSNI